MHSWSEVYTTGAYCDLLQTHSDHRLLEAEQRVALITAIAQEIDSHGGTMDVAYETHLYLAKRLDQRVTRGDPKRGTR